MIWYLKEKGRGRRSHTLHNKNDQVLKQVNNRQTHINHDILLVL